MHPLLALLARLLLGGVWVIAAVAKLVHKGSLDKAVVEFGLLPGPAARFVGRLLPWLELALGLLLLIGFRTSAAAAFSMALLLIFSAAISVNLIRGHRTKCNCFGQWGEETTSWLAVVRNAGLIAAAWIVLQSHSLVLSLETWLRGGPLLPADLSLVEFVPVLLLATTGLLIWALTTSAWDAAQAIARAEGGPMSGGTEQRTLRRWLLRGDRREEVAETRE